MFLKMGIFHLVPNGVWCRVCGGDKKMPSEDFAEQASPIYIQVIGSITIIVLSILLVVLIEMKKTKEVLFLLFFFSLYGVFSIIQGGIVLCGRTRCMFVASPSYHPLLFWGLLAYIALVSYYVIDYYVLNKK